MRRLVYVLAALGMSVPVIAWAQVMCGDTVTQSTDLTSDILGCGIDPAVEVVGPAVLRMNGFTISCTSTADPPAGIDAGVLLTGRGAKLLGPGTITNCHNGVVLVDAGGHSVTNVKAVENDDGIEVRSPDNFLGNNTVENNLDEGFDVEDGGNVFIGNRIFDNVDKGLVINEGMGNRILKNIIIGNENDDGIEVEEDASKTVIQGNTVIRNLGGIELDGADDNVISFNTVINNLEAGILVAQGAEDNDIMRNKSFNNGLDMADENSECDGNHYVSNLFVTSNQACIE